MLQFLENAFRVERYHHYWDEPWIASQAMKDSDGNPK
jgi:hypothetical protein